jgi:hypothetical protein
MKPYAQAFLLAGVVLPCILHLVASDKMPWWPDTISLGVAFGFAAAVMAWKTRKDREVQRRLWKGVERSDRRAPFKLTHYPIAASLECDGSWPRGSHLSLEEIVALLS